MRTHALTIVSLLLAAGSTLELAKAAPARPAASAAAREACVSQLSVVFANEREAQGLPPYTSSAQIKEFEQECAANPFVVNVSDRNSDAERCLSRHWTWLRGQDDAPDTGTPLMSAAELAAVKANCNALARPIPASGMAIDSFARHHGNLTTYPATRGFYSALAPRGSSGAADAPPVGAFQSESDGSYAYVYFPGLQSGGATGMLVDLAMNRAVLCRDRPKDGMEANSQNWSLFLHFDDQPAQERTGRCPISVWAFNPTTLNGWRSHLIRPTSAAAMPARQAIPSQAVASGPDASAIPSPAQQQCILGKMTAYVRERDLAGQDSTIPPEQSAAFRAQCGLPDGRARQTAVQQQSVKVADPASSLGAAADRAARAGQNLFTLPEIVAIYESAPSRDNGPQWPLPQGRFTSGSDGKFAMTRVCEDAACTAQKGALVEIASGSVIFCSLSPDQRMMSAVGSNDFRRPTVWRNFPGSQKIFAPSQSTCPARVAELDSRFLESWEYSRQRHLAQLQAPALPAQPVSPLSGAEAARLARAGQSLFTLPAIRALYQGRDGPSAKLPQGRFNSESDDRFAMTRVCTDSACKSQVTVVVDIGANDAVMCRHSYFPGDGDSKSPHGWQSAGGSFYFEIARSCPHRLSGIDSTVIAGWRNDMQKRGLIAAQSASALALQRWNGQEMQAIISGQCFGWIDATEFRSVACRRAFEVAVPSRAELAKGSLPTVALKYSESKSPVIMGFSRATRSLGSNDVTTIAYRASIVNNIPDRLAGWLRGSSRSIICTYQFQGNSPQGNFVCDITPKGGSFGESFQFNIQFVPDSETYLTPVDEGPQLHALMIGAWEALGAK